MKRSTLRTGLALALSVGAARADGAAPSVADDRPTDGASDVVRPRRADPYAVVAYTQTQFEHHADSRDQLLQGGGLQNQDRFVVRRARVRVDGTWEYTGLAVEIDGNTVRGPAFGVRRAEASAFVRGPGSLPYAKATMGLTEIPFGAELRESARRRLFLERSAVSLALFPAEQDVGAVVSGGASVLRYAFALQNGEPLDDRNPRGGRDPNARKDFVSRLGIDVPIGPVGVVAGTSFLRGKGFHPGQDATKSGLVWRDANENSTIDQGEISPVPGLAATPSASFPRWAVGADVRVTLRSSLGEGQLFAEAVAAVNLDRGYAPADPVLTGLEQRSFGWVVGASHEVLRYGVVGVRWDSYDPNADFFIKRAGKLLPASQRVSTLSPLIGVILPGRARLMFQYDRVRDHLGRDTRGVPADLDNDRYTLRAQVEL